MQSIRQLHQVADDRKAEENRLGRDREADAAYWEARDAYVIAAGEASNAALELWNAARAFVDPKWDEPHTPKYDRLIAAALQAHATDTEATDEPT
jgi:hypothetical protein